VCAGKNNDTDKSIARLKAHIAGLRTAGEFPSFCDSGSSTDQPGRHAPSLRETPSATNPRSAPNLSCRHNRPVAGVKYQPRKPENSVIHHVIRENLATFLDQAEQASNGHRLPRFVENALRDLLSCGDVRRGLNLFRCKDCGAGLTVAFSCKSRLCPSCGGKRMTKIAAHLVENVLTQCTSLFGSVCRCPLHSTPEEI
jgi:hypothetical protein